MDRVLVCCDDMFFRVNIEARIRKARLAPLPVARAAELEAALGPEGEAAGAPGGRIRAAVVDLDARGGALEIIARLAAARPGTPILAFGAHVEHETVEHETLERARRAGATAVPRSRFMREFPAFLHKVALGISPVAEAPPLPEAAPAEKPATEKPSS